VLLMNLGTQYSALRVSLAFLVVVALATAPAGAMIVVKRDFPELVARSEQIVIGTVTDIHEQQDLSGVPFTLVTFSDLTVLKGDVGATFTLRFYGGHAGDVVVGIPDMPVFTLGERDVLFAAGNGEVVCPLVGVWQGRFYVHFDPALHADVVEDYAHQPATALAGGEPRRAPAAVGRGTTPMTLDDFRNAIADELAHPQTSQ
jgi:hypothetical protein